MKLVYITVHYLGGGCVSMAHVRDMPPWGTKPLRCLSISLRTSHIEIPHNAPLNSKRCKLQGC